MGKKKEVHPTSQKRSDTLPIIGGYIDLEDIFYQVIFTVDSSKLHKKSAKGRYIRLFNDLLGDIEIVSYDFFQNIKDNYAYIIYDPLDLKEQLEEAQHPRRLCDGSRMSRYRRRMRLAWT